MKNQEVADVAELTPLISKHPPLNENYNKDPSIKALIGWGFLILNPKHGSTLSYLTLLILVGSAACNPLYRPRYAAFAVAGSRLGLRTNKYTFRV